MSGLSPTSRQLEVLRAIHASVTSRGWPPTVREIGDQLGISSTNGVVDHLRALEKRGLLERGEMTARGLRITDAGLSWLAPIVGGAA